MDTDVLLPYCWIPNSMHRTTVCYSCSGRGSGTDPLRLKQIIALMMSRRNLVVGITVKFT